MPAKSLKEWVAHLSSSSAEIIYDPAVHQDGAPFTDLLEAIDLIRRVFTKRISAALLAHYDHGAIPPSGGIVYFTSGLEHSVLIKYHFDYGTPYYEVVTVLDGTPTSVLDVGNVAHISGMKERNFAKRLLTSGHKIIFHRGILTHVDRRVEHGVFGPSIDTLVLNEILTQTIVESHFPVKSAMELGCGNGLLTTTLGVFVPTLERLLAWDLEANAITCTKRNLDCARKAYEPKREVPVSFVVGKFDPDITYRKYDLIVCNPPYVPRPEHLVVDSKRDYADATSGIDLILRLLRELPNLLEPDGKLLLMTSSTTGEATVRNALPPGFHIEHALPAAGLDVPFDVEFVLEDEGWCSQLTRTGQLWKEGDNYFHKLIPLWIIRNEPCRVEEVRENGNTDSQVS